MEKGGQPSNKLEEVARLGPALELTWKGKFEVPDFPGGGICQIFAAHPASRVSRQAYNIASKMVGDLQFSIRPRHAFWPKIFKEKCPDNKDVAVYFYPQEDPRSTTRCAILQLLKENDLMLRSIFGGVELLVFSSSVLDPKYQKWEGELYLWGVFRKLSRFGVTYYRRTKRIEM